MTAHFDHTIATAIWRLDGQADQLLDTYRREVAAKGLNPAKLIPALRFSTSDVGMSGANLYPILLAGNKSQIIPLGYPLRTQHKSGNDMEYPDVFQGYLALAENVRTAGPDNARQEMNEEDRLCLIGRLEK